MADLDPRLHAFRPDLADVKLQGRVDAKKFVEGVAMEVVVPVATLHREASATAMQTTQALLGERLVAFEIAGDWVWGQLKRDGYVGYIAKAAVSTDIDQPYSPGFRARHIFVSAAGYKIAASHQPAHECPTRNCRKRRKIFKARKRPPCFHQTHPAAE